MATVPRQKRRRQNPTFKTGQYHLQTFTSEDTNTKKLTPKSLRYCGLSGFRESTEVNDTNCNATVATTSFPFTSILGSSIHHEIVICKSQMQADQNEVASGISQHSSGLRAVQVKTSVFSGLRVKSNFFSACNNNFKGTSYIMFRKAIFQLEALSLLEFRLV